MKTHKGNLGGVIADIGRVTFDTLEKFDIPYDELYFGKPHAHFYIDDNAFLLMIIWKKKWDFIKML